MSVKDELTAAGGNRATGSVSLFPTISRGSASDPESSSMVRGGDVLRRRPAWENQVFKTIAQLTRLEGEELSLDGGVTKENHTPAIREATKEIVEDRVIPLLRALAARDRAEALRLVRQFSNRDPVLETTGEHAIPARHPVPPGAAARSWLKTLFATPPHDQVAQRHLEIETRKLMAGAEYWSSPAGKRRRLAIQIGTMEIEEPDPAVVPHSVQERRLVMDPDSDGLDTTHELADQKRTDRLGEKMLGWLRITKFRDESWEK